MELEQQNSKKEETLDENEIEIDNEENENEEEEEEGEIDDENNNENENEDNQNNDINPITGKSKVILKKKGEEKEDLKAS